MMQTVAIAPGTTGADYTVLTPGIEAWLDAQRARFVVRYIAAGGSWKHITPAEIDALHRNGIAIVLNSEGSTSDYTGGAARGTAMGTAARIAAIQLGYPTGLPLIVSVDTGLTTAQLPLARSYVEAFFSAAAPYRPALYGPVNLYHEVMRHAPVYWMPNATSWQAGLKPTDVVHVRQHRSLHPPGVDPNTAVASFKAWLPTADPPTPPAPEVLPVEYFVRFKGYANVFHCGAGGAIAVEQTIVDKGRGVLGDPLVIDHAPTRASICHAAGIPEGFLLPTADGA